MQSLDPRKEHDSYYEFLWCQDLRLETTYSIWESLHMDLFLPTPGFIFLYFKSRTREAAKHANHTCRLPNLFWRLSLTLQPPAIQYSNQNIMEKSNLNSNKTLDFPWCSQRPGPPDMTTKEAASSASWCRMRPDGGLRSFLTQLFRSFWRGLPIFYHHLPCNDDHVGWLVNVGPSPSLSALIQQDIGSPILSPQPAGRDLPKSFPPSLVPKHDPSARRHHATWELLWLKSGSKSTVEGGW